MRAKLRSIISLLTILLLTAILFSYAMFQGGFVSWFLFYSFLPICIYHLLLLFYPIRYWQVRRELSQRIVDTGGSIQVTLHLQRKIPLPLYYGVIEETLSKTLDWKHLKLKNYEFINTPEQLREKRIVKQFIPIGFQTKLEIPYTLKELPRGEHQMLGVRVMVSDVFGFIKKEYFYPVVDELIVQPQEREIRFVERSESMEQGQVAANAFDIHQTTVATGVREYVPGDRLSWIDWKQTAKNQWMMTKEFEQEKNNQLFIVLDACQQKNSNRIAFEATIELALSLLIHLENRAVDLRFITVGKEVERFSIHEFGQLQAAARYRLTKLQPDGIENFSAKIREIAQETNRLDRMAIMTTSLDETFIQTIRTLRHTIQISVFYIQGSALQTEEEVRWIRQMKQDGIAIQQLTERELATTPLEVMMR